MRPDEQNRRHVIVHIIVVAYLLTRAEDLEPFRISAELLQQVEHDVLMFALEKLRSPNMKGAKFVLEPVSAKLRCRVCGEEWRFSPEGTREDVSEAIHFVPEMAHVYLKCPRCGSHDFEVAEGRGVWLASIKGVKRDG